MNRALNLLQPLIDMELRTEIPQFAEKYNTKPIFTKRIEELYSEDVRTGYSIVVNVLSSDKKALESSNPIHIEAIAKTNGYTDVSCFINTPDTLLEYCTVDARYNDGEPRSIEDVIDSAFKEINDTIENGNYRERALLDGYADMRQFVDEHAPSHIVNLNDSTIQVRGETAISREFIRQGVEHTVTFGIVNKPDSLPRAIVRHMYEGDRLHILKPHELILDPAWSADECYWKIRNMTSECLINNMSQRLGLSIVDDLSDSSIEPTL